MTGQQRTRGVDDVNHRDVALLPADGDAPVVQDLERVAIESLKTKRPARTTPSGRSRGWPVDDEDASVVGLATLLELLQVLELTPVLQLGVSPTRWRRRQAHGLGQRPSTT